MCVYTHTQAHTFKTETRSKLLTTYCTCLATSLPLFPGRTDDLMHNMRKWDRSKTLRMSELKETGSRGSTGKRLHSKSAFTLQPQDSQHTVWMRGVGVGWPDSTRSNVSVFVFSSSSPLPLWSPRGGEREGGDKRAVISVRANRIRPGLTCGQMVKGGRSEDEWRLRCARVWCINVRVSLLVGGIAANRVGRKGNGKCQRSTGSDGRRCISTDSDRQLWACERYFLPNHLILSGA